MDITITCPCGEKVTRNEGSAGAVLACCCGRELKFPSLAELRKMQGEPPDPERLIRGGIEVDELFPDHACSGCFVRTDSWVPVMIECESGIASGGISWLTFLALLLLAPLAGVFVVFRWRDSTVVSRGKGYRVPLLACAECQKKLVKPDPLLECLRSVPVYERLLDKYPDARVYVVAR